MDAATALMSERQRYVEWIAALEAKRAVTPPHVFARVHDDYVKRLDAVTSQLQGRTAELQNSVTTMTARLAEIHSKERALTDKRFESELRAEVGELNQDEWKKLSTASDEELDRLAADRKRTSEEMERLQQILSMAAVPGDGRPSGTLSAGSAKQPAPAAAEPSVGSHKAAEPAGGGRSAQPPQRQSFDELAFLQSVTGQREDAHRRSDPAAAPAPAPAPPLAPAPAPARHAPSGNVSAIQARSHHDEATESPTAPPLGESADQVSPRVSDELQPTSRDTGPMSSILRDMPQEHVKTLKCAECAAMNYPTEWYCERCGAELAAM